MPVRWYEKGIGATLYSIHFLQFQLSKPEQIFPMKSYEILLSATHCATTMWHTKAH